VRDERSRGGFRVGSKNRMTTQAQHPPETFLATRELCLSEGFWNVAWVLWQGSSLFWLVPLMHGKPVLQVICFLGALILIAVRGALGLRWFWRLRFVNVPTTVQPLHWEDENGLSSRRLVWQGVILLMLGALIGILAHEQELRALWIMAILVLPCVLISLITGLRHLRLRKRHGC